MIYTFPEVLPVGDDSHPKIPKTKQFENVRVQPRNFRNVDTTFLILTITGKVLTYTFPEVLPVWDASHPKILKMKQFETLRVQPRNFRNVATTLLSVSDKLNYPYGFLLIRYTRMYLHFGTNYKKFLKFGKADKNIFRGIFLRRNFPQENFPGFIEVNTCLQP